MKKVSAYLEEKVIDRLRREALRRHGSLRSLSGELEEIVRESFVVDEGEAALAAWTGESAVAMGFQDVKPIKLAPGPSLKEIVRQEREHRHEAVSRRKRRA